MALFAVAFTYGDQERKVEVRPKHRAYLEKLLGEGKIHESGPFTDESGALLVYDVASEAEAKELLANDPYTVNGVIGEVSIHEWNVVFKKSAT